MKPYVVGGVCHRVQQAVDQSMVEGAVQLPAELAAHASRCPQCAALVRETESLLLRLRGTAAHVDLGPVPGVIDAVMNQIASPSPAPAAVASVAVGGRKRQSDLRWVIGQVAAFAAMICLMVGCLTYVALKVNQVVSGVQPSAVVERWVAPFQDWSRALMRNVK